jgi:hypothetical protein
MGPRVFYFLLLAIRIFSQWNYSQVLLSISDQLRNEPSVLEVAGPFVIQLPGRTFHFVEGFLLTPRPLPLILIGLPESDLNLRLM